MCGGGGGEPTVTQTLHDELQAELQAELDAALADLKTERDAKAKEAEARSAAEAEVASLTEQIGSMDDAASDAEGASLNAQLNAAKAQLKHAEAEGASLNAQLNAAKAKVTELTAEIGTAGAAESLKGKLEAANAKVVRLTAELEAANTSLTSLRGQLTTAQQDVQQAQQQAQQQVQEAQQQAQQQVQEAQQQAQGQEANQRADNQKAAFTGVGDAAPPLSNLTMTTAEGKLKLSRSRHSTATLSSRTGLRSATIALTSGGDPGKTVIYTDLELERSVLEHYGSLRNDTDMTVLELTDDDLQLGASGNVVYDAMPQASTRWRIALPSGVSTNVAAVAENPSGAADDPSRVKNFLPVTAKAPKRANSYTGYLYGQSGTFVCRGDNCKVQVTPVYPDIVGTNGRFALLSTNVTSVTPTGTDGAFETGGTTLHFKPSSSAKFQLYTGGPVSADAEYMMFGYWREDPTSPAGQPRFGVFADAMGTDAPTTDFTHPDNFGSVTYDGEAVGAYVEQDPNNPVDTHRQGEFTADISLTTTTGGANITGTIDDFVTTPTGGSVAPRTADRWVVTLATDENDVKTVMINLGAGGAGKWTHEYVPVRVGSAETVPPAVTGVFDVEVLNFVHLLGAYGAER